MISRTISRFDHSIIHSMLDGMMSCMRDACEYICNRLPCISDRSPDSLQWCLDTILSIVIREDDSSEILECCACCIEDIGDIACRRLHSSIDELMPDRIGRRERVSHRLWRG